MRHRRHAGGKVAVQMNRRFHGRLQRLDDRIRVIRSDQAGHIFDADAVRSHSLKLFCLFHIIFKVINFAAQPRFGQGVADTALEMLAAFLDHRNDSLKIAVVVQRIKCPEDIQTVCRGSLHKGAGKVIRIVPVSDQVLCPEKHGKRGFRGISLQCPESFPGILIQKAVHGVKGCTAPCFQCPEADFVHHFGHRNHILGPSPCGKKRLMSVTKGQVFYFDRVCRLWPVVAVVHARHFYLVVITHYFFLSI